MTAVQANARLRLRYPPEIAHLHTIRYDPCCAVDGNMKREGGMTVKLVIASLHYVAKEYPWVMAFKLTDDSRIECGSSKAMVDLRALSLCYSGETWYEKHFKAEITGENNHDMYRQYIKDRLQSPDYKNHMPFSSFCKDLCAGSAGLIDPAGVALLQLSDVCESADTLRNLFVRLREKCTDNADPPFCSVVSPWVGTFLNNILGGLHTKEWIIRIDKLSSSSSS